MVPHISNLEVCEYFYPTKRQMSQACVRPSEVCSEPLDKEIQVSIY